MKQLWAPWRSSYINSGKTADCIFCSYHKSPAENDNTVLFNGAISMVLLNKFPYNNGHLLICPTRHVGRFDELTPEESIDTSRMLRHSMAVLTKKFRPDGFNVGLNIGKAAGAGIEDHLHWHVVPRWYGDMNFMPLLSEVKVIPQHLQETYDALCQHFERLD